MMTVRCDICGKEKGVIPNDQWIWSTGGLPVVNKNGLKVSICPDCAKRIKNAIDEEVIAIRFEKEL